jgi:DNA (cytosine-5)-methyltransferase 1
LGIDHAPQRNYPFCFQQGDALEFLAAVRPGDFDLIHCSPPCQKFSAATPAAARLTYPDLVAPVRALLRASGCPWVIENVVGAPLENPVMLCGLMFGLKVFRHRLFETSRLVLAPPHLAHGDYQAGSDGFCTVVSGGCWRPLAERGAVIGKEGFVSVHGHGERSQARGARVGRDGFVTVAGGGNSGLRDRTNGQLIRRRPEDGVAAWRRAMNITWMTRDELAQAIPPAYTFFIGEAMTP